MGVKDREARTEPTAFLGSDCPGKDAMLVLFDIGFIAVREAEVAILTDYTGLLGIVRLEHASSDDGVALSIGAMHRIEVDWSVFGEIH